MFKRYGGSAADHRAQSIAHKLGLSLKMNAIRRPAAVPLGQGCICDPLEGWINRPAAGRGERLLVQAAAFSRDPQMLAASMPGKPDDPHRMLYQTFSLGRQPFRRDIIIHAQDEPASLPASHIALAQRALAPGAGLGFNTGHGWDHPRPTETCWVLPTDADERAKSQPRDEIRAGQLTRLGPGPALSTTGHQQWPTRYTWHDLP